MQNETKESTSKKRGKFSRRHDTNAAHIAAQERRSTPESRRREAKQRQEIRDN